ncbi:MAG: DUF1858 domain-containing protein [candidate division Zixibacteria bacterium]|nr:DUF1858 domain-containing protein [candidate division Zixibacteria bacterium]
MDEKQKFDITPKTKVGELLDRFPHLEEILIDIAPAFRKLRNPILRKTIAKVTSLSQAAKVGNVGLGEMINRLRSEAGMKKSGDFKSDSWNESAGRPEWVNDRDIVDKIDARAMLEEGEQPLGPVMSALRRLENDQMLELITPFMPAPIIDKAREKGHKTWSDKRKADEIHTYFGNSE